MWSVATLALLTAGGVLAKPNPAETVPFDHWAQKAFEELAVQLSPDPFPDVPRGHWAFDAVEKLRRAGILVGYPQGTFEEVPAAGKAGAVPFDHWGADTVRRLEDAGVIVHRSGTDRVTESEVRDAIRRLVAPWKQPPQTAGPSGPSR